MARHNMLSVLLLTLVLASNSWLVHGVNPGFRTVLTDKGLDYVRQVGVPILEKALLTTSIPDISGKAGTPIGDVDYSLTNIKLTQFQIPQSSITTGAKGLTVQASQISLAASANWHYREDSWPHISDSGSADVSVSGTSLSVSVTVGVDSRGHPTLSALNCNIAIGKLDITFHGGASWLYNLFSSYIADTLKSSLQSQLCDSATSEINTAGNAALESLPVVIKIDNTAEINYALLQAPIFQTTYLETQHKGEFFSISKPVEAPFTPAALPPVSSTDRMMYLWLTDYIADTAGFVYQTAGLMKYNITPNMVPSGLPFQLNTESFKDLIPKLYEKYPNTPMVLGLEATKPPTLEIVPSSANFTVPGQVSVFVEFANKTRQLAFVLGLVVYADVKVAVNSTREVVTANATFLRANISLISSNIGTFDVTVLQAAANLICTAFVIPALNHYGNAGLPIPVVDGVTLVDSSITFGQHYALVATDFSYKPSLKVLDKLLNK